ncbi:hypothetical protein BDV34DRAFT_188121 [Aspergillus parasiticus]|uniref:Uncharacterized protein n=1 Tax=Aspergillus parasiticus TaxID=5067 RepID=A0A5N6DXB3_ASPPA|nr:hypothetical protein BDV34DRAFT_188121 [Aspergillus parasiticus]
MNELQGCLADIMAFTKFDVYSTLKHLFLQRPILSISWTLVLALCVLQSQGR